MKKNGFTLVELIAVIAILAVILVMFVPNLLNSINSNKNKALNKIYDLIETATRNYVMDYNVNIPTKIELEDLCDTTYIECPIINPVDNNELNGCIKVLDGDEGENYIYGSCETLNVPFSVQMNGGTPGQSFQDTYQEFARIDLIDPTHPTSKFKGWEIVKGNSKLKDNTLIIGTTETTLSAIWESMQVLTIDLDGGVVSKDQSGRYKNEEIIKLEVPTKENYKFTGWTIVEGNGIISGNTLTMGSENITIKAIWERNVYTITYELNGGIPGEKSPTSGISGSTIEVSNPSKSGYTFTGWSVSGTGALLSGTNLTIGTGDIILIANWEITNTIPVFTYTGSYQIVDDNNNLITSSTGNWKIRFLTGGTLTFNELRGAKNGIDIFLVGGGGAGSNANGSSSGGGGGGGGYTKTVEGVSVATAMDYIITIGEGGKYSGSVSTATSAFDYTANPGGKGSVSAGGAGTGSGGSGGGVDYWNRPGGGGAGTSGVYEFNNTSGLIYGGGGGGGGAYGDGGGASGGAGGAGGGGAGGNGGYQGANGIANTGGGGGGAGGYEYSIGGNGGSGIVIIRNSR